MADGARTIEKSLPANHSLWLRLEVSGFLDDDPARMPLGRLVSVTGQRLGRHWQRTVAVRTELSSTALVVLAALAEKGELTHREVAAHCWVRPATLTPIVDELAADGLLSRERDRTDRRVVRLAITGSGLEALAEAWQEVGAEFSGIVPGVPAEQEAVIREFLLGILRGLDAAGEGT